MPTHSDEATSDPEKGKRAGSAYRPLALIVLIAIPVIAVLWPPVYFHLAGTDASNYANAAEQYAHGRHAGSNLLPPEIDDPRVQSSISERVLRDSRGLLTPYIFVGSDLTFRFPHNRLTSRVMAIFSAVGLDSWSGYLNYAFLGISALLMGKFVVQLGYPRSAGLVATALFLLVPSHIELARYPMSEPLSTALVLSALVLASHPRTARSTIPALPLLALPHTRSEFMLMLLLAVVVLSFRRTRGWIPIVAALVGSSWLISNDTSLHDGFGALSFSFVPQVSWPTPSKLLGLYTNLREIPSVTLPLALVAALAGTWSTLQAKAREAGAAAGKFAKAHPWMLVSALIATVIVTDIYKSTLDKGQVILGVFRDSRYQTSWLIWESAGAPLTLLGLIGLGLAIPALVDRVGTIGWLLIIPLLAVLIDMHATPENQLWWTRRLHLVVYPALILGTATFFAWAAHHLRLPRQLPQGATPVLLAVAVLCAHVATTWTRLPDVQDGYLEADLMESMHESLSKVPDESVVLLHGDTWGQKAVAPARSFHGLYAFVVWEKSDLEGVLATFQQYDRPIFVDQQLADAMTFDGTHSQSITIPVMETPNRGRQITIQRSSP